LAVVRTGDVVELDVEARRIDVLISDDEMRKRQALFRAPAPRYTRGYGKLFLDHVEQADRGCDFDFLRGRG
jgi:dihydroxy-acid dehydratase